MWTFFNFLCTTSFFCDGLWNDFIWGLLLPVYVFNMMVLSPPSVCEVVQTLQLCSDRDAQDFVGDLSICLDGMQVDPDTFASAERERGRNHRVCI